ncbi:MAG: hypothetical protein SGPRY_006060 [Prymnesium sp.]
MVALPANVSSPPSLFPQRSTSPPLPSTGLSSQPLSSHPLVTHPSRQLSEPSTVFDRLQSASLLTAEYGSQKLAETSVLPDLIFGVIAFQPRVRSRAPYHEGVRRWVHSVRTHTSEARTHLLLFTGRGEGSIASDAAIARYLQEAGVSLVQADYQDHPSRVAHSDASQFVWCVVRNRWFVIARYLAPRVGEYRYVLMCDTKDVILQAPPFEWGALTGGSHKGEWLRRAVVFSGEGSGRVRTLQQSKKGLPRTMMCAHGASATQRQALLHTEPLNAGVTLGGAEAFLNFSLGMMRVIRRVTSKECIAVKDCTDQGLYNLLVYLYWGSELPHTRKLVLSMERAPSYTLGHKQPCCTVDSAGRVLNDARMVPPIVHQFAKGLAGRVLPRTLFWRKVTSRG